MLYHTVIRKFTAFYFFGATATSYSWVYSPRLSSLLPEPLAASGDILTEPAIFLKGSLFTMIPSTPSLLSEKSDVLIIPVTDGL